MMAFHPTPYDGSLSTTTISDHTKMCHGLTRSPSPLRTTYRRLASHPTASWPFLVLTGTKVFSLPIPFPITMPPRRARPHDATTSKPPLPRWYVLLCAVAYELRPFTPPTRGDLVAFAHSTRQTLTVLATEARQFIVHVARPLGGQAARAMTSWRHVVPLVGFGSAWYVAARLEFGVVFLILSVLVLIFTVGLGDDASRGGERRVSPWSVFNVGMERLLGTVDADALVAQYVGNNMGMAMGVAGGGGGGGGGLMRPRVEAEEEAEGKDDGADEEEEEEEVRRAQAGGGGGGQARRSGKKARRKGFDKKARRRKQQGGVGERWEEEWEDDWVSDEGEG